LKGSKTGDYKVNCVVGMLLRSTGVGCCRRHGHQLRKVSIRFGGAREKELARHKLKTLI
jgi:hypothetical protein